MSLMW